jgi:Protein of unknown function (DUF4054)
MGSTYNSWPNFNAWLQTAWGAGAEYWTNIGSQNFNVGFCFGQNPPYYLDDFLATFPKFFGLPVLVPNCAVAGNVLTVPQAYAAQFTVGQFLTTGGVLPLGAVVLSVSGASVTLNVGGTASSLAVNLYANPPVPVFVLTLYLSLANASLQQARWQEQWYLAMGWFIAHYATLYARSDAAELFTALQTAIHGEVPAGATPGTVYTLSVPPPGGALQSLTKNGTFLTPGVDYALSQSTVTLMASTVVGDSLFATWPVPMSTSTATAYSGAQIAAQALAGGIQTSKSVGDVSVSYQPLASLEDWGQWNLTLYGQQLATMAKTVGSGPALMW